MKIVGLITEYNPFHNGHLRHIQEAKRISGADTVLVVMSGDYVQRGVPAIMPKRIRAEMALKCGASAVFELPVCYATGSAELFAEGAVSFLDRLKIVDSICFGSECNDLDAMSHIAEILSEEPEEYRARLRSHLKKGASFPAARQSALLEDPRAARFQSVLKDPNNILGIEYLKALRRFGSRMEPFTIRREGSHYHDSALSSSRLSSASAIRSLLAYSGSSIHTEESGSRYEEDGPAGIFGELEEQVPACCLELLRDCYRVQYPIFQNDFSLLLKYKLLNKHPQSLLRYMDTSEELANRICGQLDNFFNYRQFCELLKTREVTQTRINRALLHIMLGTKKKDVNEYIQNGYHFYARLLGYRKDREKVLTKIFRESSIPLLARLQDAEELPQAGKKLLRNDILASNLYSSVITEKYRTAFRNEYRQALIRI